MQVKEHIRALQTQRNVKSDEKNRKKNLVSLWRKREFGSVSKYHKYNEIERLKKLLNKQKIQRDQRETMQDLVNPVYTVNESLSSLPKTPGSAFSTKQTLHHGLLPRRHRT